MEDCVFKGIKILPGWMVADQRQEIDEVVSRRKKKKVIDWVERSQIDCMSDLVLLFDTIITRIDARYAASVTEAACPRKLLSCARYLVSSTREVKKIYLFTVCCFKCLRKSGI